MARASRIDFDDPTSIDEDEEETLAAIDEGIRDGEVASRFGEASLDHVDLPGRFRIAATFIGSGARLLRSG